MLVGDRGCTGLADGPRALLCWLWWADGGSCQQKNGSMASKNLQPLQKKKKRSQQGVLKPVLERLCSLELIFPQHLLTPGIAHTLQQVPPPAPGPSAPRSHHSASNGNPTLWAKKEPGLVLIACVMGLSPTDTQPEPPCALFWGRAGDAAMHPEAVGSWGRLGVFSGGHLTQPNSTQLLQPTVQPCNQANTS